MVLLISSGFDKRDECFKLNLFLNLHGTLEVDGDFVEVTVSILRGLMDDP